MDTLKHLLGLSPDCQEQTRQKPDRTHTDARAVASLAGHAASRQDSRLAQTVGRRAAIQPFPSFMLPPTRFPLGPCYVLYVLYLTRQPTEHPLSGSLLYVLYVLYFTRQPSTLPAFLAIWQNVRYLTRQPTEHPLSPSFLLYVLYALALYSTYTTNFRAYRICSTYSTYSNEKS